MKTKLRRDDTVKVVSGKDRGKTGKVLRINKDTGRVIVQGLNMVRKAVKPRRQNDKGGIIDVEAALDISNVMIVCKKCGPTRIGYVIEKNEKRRICRKCGEAV
jgi:large subunit ribosomal protein L24